jgi:tRNA dimethylallyltransferase
MSTPIKSISSRATSGNLRPKVVVVVGPTGSGKSSLALALAKEFNGYLISADSRQIYRGLDIGTNKDPGVWRLIKGKRTFLVDGVPEYMIDVASPKKDYSISLWLRAVKKIIKSQPNRLPIVVGGTGLYTTALVHGFTLSGVHNEELRVELETRFEIEGLSALVQQLISLKPDNIDKIDLKNPRRVLRALEIALTPKVSRPNIQPSEFDFLEIAPAVDREKLYKKLDIRAVEQFNSGLADEVQRLLKKGYRDTKALTGIGYRQVIDYLDGKIDLAEAIRIVQRDNRRYAKRQLTWYRRYPEIKIVKNLAQARGVVSKFLK